MSLRKNPATWLRRTRKTGRPGIRPYQLEMLKHLGFCGTVDNGSLAVKKLRLAIAGPTSGPARRYSDRPSDAQVQELLQTFRRKYPGIADFWASANQEGSDKTEEPSSGKASPMEKTDLSSSDRRDVLRALKNLTSLQDITPYLTFYRGLTTHDYEWLASQLPFESVAFDWVILQLPSEKRSKFASLAANTKSQEEAAKTCLRLGEMLCSDQKIADAEKLLGASTAIYMEEARRLASLTTTQAAFDVETSWVRPLAGKLLSYLPIGCPAFDVILERLPESILRESYTVAQRLAFGFGAGPLHILGDITRDPTPAQTRDVESAPIKQHLPLETVAADVAHAVKKEDVLSYLKQCGSQWTAEQLLPLLPIGSVAFEVVLRDITDPGLRNRYACSKSAALRNGASRRIALGDLAQDPLPVADWQKPAKPVREPDGDDAEPTVIGESLVGHYVTEEDYKLLKLVRANHKSVLDGLMAHAAKTTGRLGLSRHKLLAEFAALLDK